MPTPDTMPQVCTAAATGRHPATSIFSKAMTTPGYCSCTKRNCREDHRPAGSGGGGSGGPAGRGSRGQSRDGGPMAHPAAPVTAPTQSATASLFSPAVHST